LIADTPEVFYEGGAYLVTEPGKSQYEKNPKKKCPGFGGGPCVRLKREGVPFPLGDSQQPGTIFLSTPPLGERAFPPYVAISRGGEGGSPPKEMLRGEGGGGLDGKEAAARKTPCGKKRRTPGLFRGNWPKKAAL